MHSTIVENQKPSKCPGFKQLNKSYHIHMGNQATIFFLNPFFEDYNKVGKSHDVIFLKGSHKSII